MEYNFRFCDLKSLFVNGDSKTHMFCCSLFLSFWHVSFFCTIVLRFVFCFLGLDSCVIIGESYFEFGHGLPLKYFHIMFCMCGDNNSYRH